MPINLSVEFPKLEAENQKLRYENTSLKETIAALEERNGKLVDALRYLSNWVDNECDILPDQQIVAKEALSNNSK